MAKKPPYDLRGSKYSLDTDNQTGSVFFPTREKTYAKQAAPQTPVTMADKQIRELKHEFKTQTESMNNKFENLVTQLKTMFETYQTEVKSEIAKLNKQISDVREDFRAEVDGVKASLNATDKKGNETAAEAKAAQIIAKMALEQVQVIKGENLKLQCQLLEGCLRMRGVPEDVAEVLSTVEEEGETSTVLEMTTPKENLDKKAIIFKLAEYMEIPYQELEFKCVN